MLPVNSISLNWEQIVPKIATLFVHLLANVKKEIMSKGLGSACDNITIMMRFLKHLVNVRAVAMHFFSEPFDRPALFVENCLDNMSYMEIRHSCI